MSEDISKTKKLLFRVGSEVVDRAKTIAPYRTGNLKKDIQVIEVSENEVTIGNTELADYARFVHEGTGLHGYKKKRYKVKGAFGRKGSVIHPGMEARPYLFDALEEYQTDGGLKRALDEHGSDMEDDIIKELKKSIDGKNVGV